MKRVFLCFLLVLGSQPVLAQYGPDRQTLQETERWLRVVHFAEAFQGGIRKGVATAGKSNPAVERILAAPPERIEALVASVFARNLSAAEARDIANFYDSAVGRSVTAQQSAQIQNPSPAIQLAPVDRIRVVQFSHSVAGTKAGKLMTSESVRDEYVKLIQQAFRQ